MPHGHVFQNQLHGHDDKPKEDFHISHLTLWGEAFYTGALACYTAAFAPIGTACSIVLSKIVHKSEVENSGADGEGIKFATAKAHNFCEDGIEGSKESPAI